MTISAGGNELLNPTVILERLGVTKGSVLADLGCGGAGHFIIPAAQMVGSDTVVYAVDILKSVLHNVASKARMDGINNIRTVWTNLEKLGATKINDESLDFAFLINILFQSTRHQEVITEAKRMIKPGGKLLVIDWLNAKMPFGPALENRVNPENIKRICQSLNLKLIEEFKPGNYHFALIFQK